MFQVTVLRGENASAKSLHSVVQTLESDKVKLELKVKNLELQLKENKRQLSSSSGKGRLPSAALCTALPPEEPFLVEMLFEDSSRAALTLTLLRVFHYLINRGLTPRACRPYSWAFLWSVNVVTNLR